MTEEFIAFLIERLLQNARETKEEIEKNKDRSENLLNEGKSLAYYEMLDILKSEIEINGYDAAKYGLDISMEKFL